MWPIAIAMAALTSQSNAAKHQTLELLESTDGGTGNMHESFDGDDDTKFTRPWFSWADMTYVDLILESVNYQYPSGLSD